MGKSKATVKGLDRLHDVNQKGENKGKDWILNEVQKENLEFAIYKEHRINGCGQLPLTLLLIFFILTLQVFDFVTDGFE